MMQFITAIFPFHVLFDNVIVFWFYINLDLDRETTGRFFYHKMTLSSVQAEGDSEAGF